MTDKCPVTGLPTQSLFSDEEMAEFTSLDDQLKAWLARVEFERPRIREAVCRYYKGEFNEVIVTLRAEFADIDSIMTPQDMTTVTRWFSCLMNGMTV
jgi:hypothetical protein